MSAKDWKLIAQILREQHASYNLVKALADAFKENYPRFNPWLFIDAAYEGELRLRER